MQKPIGSMWSRLQHQSTQSKRTSTILEIQVLSVNNLRLYFSKKGSISLNNHISCSHIVDMKGNFAFGSTL